MKVKVLVIQERPEEYRSRKGVDVKLTVLTVVDMEEESSDRLLNTFDYVLSEEEANYAGGKLVEKQIVVAVRTLEVKFGGRLRARGRIITPKEA